MTTLKSFSEIENVKTLLKYTFGLVPIIAGLDKFLNLLTHWPSYVPVGIQDALPMSTASFMMIVGVIEIIAGILVLTKTTLGAYVVAGWLVLIAVILIFSGSFDIAVRDLVMAIAAFSYAKLSTVERIKASN